MAWRRWVAATAAMVALAVQAAPAVPEAPPDVQPDALPPSVIVLDGASQARVPLVDKGQFLIERDGQVPRDGPPRWRAADRAALSPGYTRDVYWLRWVLRHDAASAERFVLMIDPARTESVALYRRRLLADGSATPWMLERAGTDLAFAARPLALRESAFALRIEPGETWELRLRAASRGSLTIEPGLWTSEAMTAEQQWRVWRDGMLSAVGLTLAALAAGLAISLRDRGYGWIAAFLSSAMLYEMAMRGTAFQRFWPEATDWAQRALGTTGALTTVFQLMAMATVLRLRATQPAVFRALVAVIGMSLIAVAVCVVGDYQTGTRMAAPTNLALTLIGLIASARAMRRGDPAGGVWLCAIGGVVLGIAPRYFSLLGVLPYADWVELAPSVVGTLGAAAVLVTMLRQLQRERFQHAQALEAAVLERTAELARASAHAQASDAAKGRLLGHIGHDLRAPLASMVQLTRRLAPGSEFESTRQALEHGGEMLLDTIDELQRFARQPTAEADVEVLNAPVYLHGLLHELALQSQALMMAGKTRLVLSADHALPAVVALDARRLRQVLVNLLSNAAKYAQAGAVELRARVDKDRLLLCVVDQGPGLEPEELARIFDPFARGRGVRAVPGLGLGLAIARQTVRAMDGELSARSEPGRGSSFIVDLPLIEATEDEVQWPALQTQGGMERLGQGWVAVVWDRCATVREVMLERLLQCGFDAREVDRMEELPAALEEAAATGQGLLLASSPESLPSVEAWQGWCARWPEMKTLLCAASPRHAWPTAAGLVKLPKPAPQTLWVPALWELCRAPDHLGS